MSMRIDVRSGGTTRCPYCHDDCSSAQENLVCNDCLARHHRACWQERGECASCGASRPASAPAPAVPDDLVQVRNQWRFTLDALARCRVHSHLRFGLVWLAGLVGFLYGVLSPQFATQFGFMAGGTAAMIVTALAWIWSYRSWQALYQSEDAFERLANRRRD